MCCVRAVLRWAAAKHRPVCRAAAGPLQLQHEGAACWKGAHWQLDSKPPSGAGALIVLCAARSGEYRIVPLYVRWVSQRSLCGVHAAHGSEVSLWRWRSGRQWGELAAHNVQFCLCNVVLCSCSAWASCKLGGADMRMVCVEPSCVVTFVNVQ